MAEPITAGAIAAIIAEKAAEEVGKRLGEGLGNFLNKKIFGEDSTTLEIQKELRVISQRLTEILSYCRATLVLVERLPIVIEESLDRHDLYQAHMSLSSTYEAFMILDEWDDKITFNTAKDIISNWNIVIDKEARLDFLMRLPTYGDFLIVFTNNLMRESVTKGIEKKLLTIEDSIKSITDDKINPCAEAINRILQSPQVKSGTLIDAFPWITWTLNDTRTTTTVECIPREGGEHNPGGRGGGRDICHKIQVPDTAWNNSLSSTQAELNALSTKLEEYRKILQANVVVRQTYALYLTSLRSN